MTDVKMLIDRIKTEKISKDRIDHAERVADLVAKMAHERVEEQLVQNLVECLSDKEDAVRYWIAVALGHLGPQARAAIPALEDALKQVEGVHGSKTSASGIRLAIGRIKSGEADTGEETSEGQKRRETGQDGNRSKSKK
jgi:HEAT repeat protein